MYFPVLLGLSILPVVGRVCVCVCVRAAACCPLLPPRPVTQLRTGPTLFRDVLIKKQRWTSESHAGCRTGTVTQCRSLCSGDGRAGFLAGNMAASDSPAKNKARVWRCVGVSAVSAEETDPKHHSHHPSMWTAAMVWPPTWKSPYLNPPYTWELPYYIKCK